MGHLDEKLHLEWIRAGLERPGKTRIGLARHLNIAHPQITQLLKGKRRLKVDEVPKIAEYLGTPPPGVPSSEYTELINLLSEVDDEVRQSVLTILRNARRSSETRESEPE